MRNNRSHHCRVCGLFHVAPPYGSNSDDPSFEICACCGVEFGYEDATLVSARRFRRDWLSKGAKWVDEAQRPNGWTVESQLENVPEGFI